MELLLILGLVISAGIGWWIATQKRRSEVEGAALGCLLGPIGWIIEAVLPTGEPASAPVARPAPSTSASSSARQATDKKVYSWQVMYVPGGLVLDPDDSRKPKGPDGPPPGWLQFDEKTSVSNLVNAMAESELHYFHDRGYRIVEAVWRPGSARPTILAAYGDPAKTYNLLWPDYPRVKWSSLVGQDGTWEPGRAGEDVPQLMVPVRSGSAASAKEAADTKLESSSATAPTPAGEDRPNEERRTKTCPDCAETILEAARICRFCRYEFWPADAPPPQPSGDVAEADVAPLPADDSSAADDMPEDGTEVTEGELPPPEPAMPEPEPPAPEPSPTGPEPEVPVEQEEAPPPAAPPPGYAPPPPAYAPPQPPPAGQPAPPPYAPQHPPYAPPPPGWQPPPQGQPPGQVPPGQGPWPPPPPRPPDRPRE